MDLDTYRQWIGRTEQRTDLVTPAPLASLSAALDREDPDPAPGTELPPLWHWMFFTPRALARNIGPDGHERRGGFLPPVELPRRMWAGGRLEFRHALKVGDEIRRSSRILDVTGKQGRSGTLVFVTVRHEIANSNGVAIAEEHDIVYRDHPAPGAPQPAPEVAPENAEFSREIVPDPVLLFRYSALTFNGHRIHYDRDYATQVEGYPGLIVHGPLIATLLLEAFRQADPDKRITRFSFRAVGPLFDIHRFDVCGRITGPDSAELWTDENGRLTMKAVVGFE